MISLNNLSIQETELILAGLRKLPMEFVEELVLKIKIQAIPQAQEIQNKIDPETATQPKI